MKRLLRDAAALALLALLGELAVRTADPRYRGHRFDGATTGGHPLAINARGLRGPQTPSKVVALGDSTTFGTGVAWDAAWPARIGAVNLAAPAASLADLTLAVDEHPAEQAVLAASGNMVALSWIRRGQAPGRVSHPPERAPSRLKAAVYGFALPSFLTLNAERGMYWIGLKDHRVDPAAPYGALLAHGWRQLDLDPAVVEQAWAAFEADLARLRDRLSARNVPLRVTFIPARFTLSDDAADNEKAVPKRRLRVDPVARTGEICRRLGIP